VITKSTAYFSIVDFLDPNDSGIKHVKTEQYQGLRLLLISTCQWP